MPRFFCFGVVHDDDNGPITASSIYDRQVQIEPPKPIIHSSKPLKIQKLREEPCRVSMSKISINVDEHEELRHTLNLMINQEGELYSCDDYFYTEREARIWKPDFEKKTSTKRGNRYVDECCREQIAEWGFRLIDYFRVSREVVYVAMSYLDRLMTKCNLDRAAYKLAATTCLILAMKVHHSKRVFLTDIIHDLSRGEFDSEDIARMEKQIVDSLQWLLHPPTPQNYITRLLIMTTDISSKIYGFNPTSVCEYAIFFSELSVLDYYFVTQRQSVVAVACIINAMEGLGLLTARHTIDPWFTTRDNMTNFIVNMCMLVHQEPDLRYISYIRGKLWNLFERSDEYLNVQSGEKSLFKIRSDSSQNISESHISSSSSSSSPTSITRYPRPPTTESQ